MPVPGTPIGPPSGPTPSAPAQTTPDPTRLFETPLPARRRAVSVQQGACSTARFQLLDARGDPYDLTAFTAANYTLAAAVRETLGRSSENAVFDVGTIEVPASSGWVVVPLPRTVTNAAGVYVLETVITDDTDYPRCAADGEVVTAMGALDDDVYRITTNARTYDFATGVVPVVGVDQTLYLKQQLVKDVCIVVANTLYLAVERGVHGTPDPSNEGPPTLAEVRLHLRDFPESNLLLDEYEFDHAEVLLAAERCVAYFNELRPPLSMRFDTRTFPYRYHWMEGISYLLYRTAAAWHRRNRLPYSAGGVTIDDVGKEREYLQAAQLHEATWKDWARREKLALNIAEGYGSVGSEYSWR